MGSGARPTTGCHTLEPFETQYPQSVRCLELLSKRESNRHPQGTAKDRVRGRSCIGPRDRMRSFKLRSFGPTRNATAGDPINKSTFFPGSQGDYGFNACSMAFTTFSPSGVSFESKRPTMLPVLSTRNLLKFHVISPANLGSVFSSVKNL
jgi:hypothetical protein